jgi:hypothetical protein
VLARAELCAKQQEFATKLPSHARTPERHAPVPLCLITALNGVGLLLFFPPAKILHLFRV